MAICESRSVLRSCILSIVLRSIQLTHSRAYQALSFRLQVLLVGFSSSQARGEGMLSCAMFVASKRRMLMFLWWDYVFEDPVTSLWTEAHYYKQGTCLELKEL